MKMPDENNSTIYIEYSTEVFPPTNWQSLKEYALDFKVTNSGIFRTPQLELNLKNRNGRFTGNGDITIQTAKLLRIRANVRGITDTLFYGRVRPFTSTNKSKREVLNVSASGLVTQKLLWDKITHEYLTEQNESSTERTMKQVIEHMLTHPDSDPEGTRGDLGVSLVTDSGNITTEPAGHNFDKQTLLDAIKQICEYIGYAGYEEISGSALNLHLYPYGWQPANPAITIPTSPQEIIEREYTVDDPIYNHIYVFASPQICFPDSDRYTERGMEKGYWTANNATTTITDEIINRINKKCVKLTKPDGTSNRIDATLDLTVDFPTGINIKDRGITDLIFDFYSCRPDLNCPEGDLNITIYDSENRFLTWGCGAHSLIADDEFWRSYNIPLGMFVNGIWKKAPTHEEAGMTEETTFYGTPAARWNGNASHWNTFNWIIKKIRFRNAAMGYSGAITTRLDGLHFEGAIEVNPILDSSLAAFDQPSIDD